jgi:hypothetical protein
MANRDLCTIGQHALHAYYTFMPSETVSPKQTSGSVSSPDPRDFCCANCGTAEPSVLNILGQINLCGNCLQMFAMESRLAHAGHAQADEQSLVYGRRLVAGEAA